VNIAGEKLAFRRVRQSAAPHRVSHAGLEEPTAKFSHTGRHPGFGFMKGLIIVKEGFDVTRPFDDEPWDRGYLGRGGT
jgi:hypothetical protein